MAEALLIKMLKKEAKIDVSSAGVQTTPGLSANPMTLRVLEDEGIDFTQFQSRVVTPALINEATYVFTMTQQHRDFLIRYYPQHQEKIFLLTEWNQQEDISDPIGGTLQDYRECCEAIQSSLSKMPPWITAH